MTPRTQTIFAGDPTGTPGNCLQAALASLLDLRIEEVPHFVGDDAASDGELHWWTEMVRWCRARGWEVQRGREPDPGELYAAVGPSPRDPENVIHVAIYRDGELVHDPHPDGTGVVEVRGCFMLRPLVAREA